MTELELEDLLSRPYAEDVEWARRLDGDLMLLGAGGKMGPSLAHRAVRALKAGKAATVFAVSRYSDPRARAQLESWGVQPIAADLLQPGALQQLPDVANVIYMAARKFGTGFDASQTWAINAYLPGLVAERYKRSRIVAFSTGNVYPLTNISSGGPTEDHALGPVGEYGQSALARERIFDYFSRTYSTPVAILRLNYAVELRYGVLADIARNVLAGERVRLLMGFVNVIWQGDANSVALRVFDHCATPPFVLNLTGPGMYPVRRIAETFGRLLGREPRFKNSELASALLSNAERCVRLFGPPKVAVEEAMEWVADWLLAGGTMWDKPTHFSVRDGKF